MEPANIIIWTCVLVFIVTATIALLHVSGIRPLPNPRHGEILFKVLIVEVAVIAISIFGSYKELYQKHNEEVQFAKPAVGWKQFTDKERGFAVSFPNRWFLDDRSYKLDGTFFIQVPDNTKVNINITYEKVIDKYVNDIKSYFDETIIENKTMFKATISNETRFNYKGFQSMSFIAQLNGIGKDSTSFKQYVMQVYDQRSGVVYTLAFTCPDSVWEKYYPDGRDIMNSFEWRENKA